MVHVEDVAGGMWACAEWMAKLGRKDANSIAGEEIVFKNDKSKAKEVEGMAPPEQKCIAPLFNIVRHFLFLSRRIYSPWSTGGRQ